MSQAKKPTAGRGRRTGIIVLAVIGAIAAGLIVLAQAPGIRGQAPDFQMEVYRGEDVIGGPQVGFHEVLDQGKPVMLNFWAGLCPPCRAEMPAFQRLHERFGDRFIMLGVDVGPFTLLGSRQDALALLDELSITYPTAQALDGQPLRDYGVQGMPTTVFLTADGTISSRHIGFLTERDAERELLKILETGS